jgi:enoyl-CoA hydratase
MNGMGKILLEQAGAVATVTLSNPGKLNAIDVAMWQQLAITFSALSQDSTLRCVIIRGADGNFAAGADIEEFATVRSTPAQGIVYHTETIARALDAIAGCLHPTIAVIEGVCVGGGLEIACACDLRIASPDARFGIPIKRLGFPLAPSELESLLQLVGKAVALEILLEGRVFDAVEAKEKGLLTRIANDPHAAANRSAASIADGAPLAARLNKQLVRRLSASAPALDAQELQQVFNLLQSNDYREGVQSFLEKRPPLFCGK